MDKRPGLKYSLFDKKNFRYEEFFKAEDVVDFLWNKDLDNYTLTVDNSCGRCWMAVSMVCDEAGRFEAFLKSFKDE